MLKTRIWNAAAAGCSATSNISPVAEPLYYRVTISTFNQRSIAVLHVLAAFDVDVCLILLVG